MRLFCALCGLRCWDDPNTDCLGELIRRFYGPARGVLRSDSSRATYELRVEGERHAEPAVAIPEEGDADV